MKVRKQRNRFGQILRRWMSVLTAVCLLAGLLPAMDITVFAASTLAADGVTEVDTWEDLSTALIDKDKVRLTADVACANPTADNYLKVGGG